jgi:SecD/SecF fusion protein
MEARNALCSRLSQIGLRRVSVVTDGSQLVMRAPRSQAAVTRAAARPAVITVYDWDANVSGGRAPEVPFSGATALFQAVQAAAQMKPKVEPTDLRAGATISLEEADIANDTPPVRRHYLFDVDGRLLAGPAWSRGTLAASAGAAARGSQILTVPRGVAVVEAQRPADQADGVARYFVLEDDAELSPAHISKATAAVDQVTQEPIVQIALGESGRTAFAALTRRIAERSAPAVASGGAGADALERVAVLLDDRVVSLPTIDPRQAPQGIDGSTGLQLGGFNTAADARRLALLLPEKPFPAHLVPLNPPR